MSNDLLAQARGAMWSAWRHLDSKAYESALADATASWTLCQELDDLDQELDGFQEETMVQALDGIERSRRWVYYDEELGKEMPFPQQQLPDHPRSNASFLPENRENGACGVRGCQGGTLPEVT